jgi:hypothetical protein
MVLNKMQNEESKRFREKHTYENISAFSIWSRVKSGKPQERLRKFKM